MSGFFRPLDSEGRVAAHQQTRVSAFLVSAHGALARQSAFSLPARLESAWQTELNAQLYRETEIVSLLLRATSWAPDPGLGYMAVAWESAWYPAPIYEISDWPLAVAAGLATLAHAVHAGIRPAALLPVEANPNDPFVMALRRIEFESGRLLQAQILSLKGPDFLPFRDVVTSALERRHTEVRKLWRDMLQSVGIGARDSNDEKP
ncbi:hypothetical protein JJB99_23525 [Bradyrhizobium diazoefficiens]|uniref:hypothetical protein n=1 Tax=Bradyrhizobium diazoefficiens TaxID=1355477 RepID=UPI0019098207|nr:hypothetical protein [Bradyrhizobium diazoefficiens]QQO12438.1 hypothetical protein JJB99_23525 [Bradyrhizobium diazoefficiens]